MVPKIIQDEDPRTFHRYLPRAHGWWGLLNDVMQALGTRINIHLADPFLGQRGLVAHSCLYLVIGSRRTAEILRGLLLKSAKHHPQGGNALSLNTIRSRMNTFAKAVAFAVHGP